MITAKQLLLIIQVIGGVHAAGHLGPPEVDAGEEGHQHAADHDEVEVGDDEVGLREVNIHSERTKKDTRQSADREESDEGEGIEHWSLEGD